MYLQGATAGPGWWGTTPRAGRLPRSPFYLDDVPVAIPVGDHRVRNVGFHPVEADHLPTFIKVSPRADLPQPGPVTLMSSPQASIVASESLFSASDDVEVGGGLGGLLMASGIRPCHRKDAA